MLVQCSFVRDLARQLDVEVDSMPLFPTAEGTRVRKVDAVSTIIELASKMGQHTICPTSQGQLLGGHSMRTGGAQALAGLGVDPIRDQTMGRGNPT